MLRLHVKTKVFRKRVTSSKAATSREHYRPIPSLTWFQTTICSNFRAAPLQIPSWIGSKMISKTSSTTKTMEILYRDIFMYQSGTLFKEARATNFFILVCRTTTLQPWLTPWLTDHKIPKGSISS
mmetsp:Transcript_3236/g.6295  ORF Transcript_3236/g.6295 Transcript_3236/m.6295 type:complete len:125 (-) Transcript_3236:569-943(-)